MSIQEWQTRSVVLSLLTIFARVFGRWDKICLLLLHLLGESNWINCSIVDLEQIRSAIIVPGVKFEDARVQLIGVHS